MGVGLALALGCPADEQDADSGAATDGEASTGSDGARPGEGEGEGESPVESEGEAEGEGEGPFPDEDCDGLFEPPFPGSEAQIVLRNETAQVLFVGYPGECVFEPFHVKIEAKLYGHEPDECVAQCDDVAAGVCVEDDCGPCGSYEVVRLAPGEQWESAWDGRVFVQREVPDGCGPEAECRRCEAPRAVEGGFAVEAVATATCTGTQCECTGTATACTVSTTAADPARPLLARVETIAGAQDELTLTFR
ncbi:MAG: hypothetical protein AAF721_20630 [Myxococcota bacterium]